MSDRESAAWGKVGLCNTVEHAELKRRVETAEKTLAAVIDRIACVYEYPVTSVVCGMQPVDHRHGHVEHDYVAPRWLTNILRREA